MHSRKSNNSRKRMNSIPFVTAGLSSIFIQIEQRTLVAAGVIFRAVDPVFDMFHPPVDAKEIRSLHVFLLIQEGIGSLAELPSKPVLQAMLLGVLQAPSRNLVSVLNAKAASILNVLNAYKDKVEKQ